MDDIPFYNTSGQYTVARPYEVCRESSKLDKFSKIRSICLAFNNPLNDSLKINDNQIYTLYGKAICNYCIIFKY